MAKIGVSFNIDVKKIDKARLHKGAKGTYLNVTTFIDLDNKDQYDNNGFASQDVSKEEREQGIQGNILGNCKVFWSDGAQQPQQQSYQQAPQQNYQQPPPNQPMGVSQAPQQAPSMESFDDDIPF